MSGIFDIVNSSASPGHGPVGVGAVLARWTSCWASCFGEPLVS
ncbi:MAG: hypothetical protein ACLSVD_03810 [Eggerthellaceae bacterium]